MRSGGGNPGKLHHQGTPIGHRRRELLGPSLVLLLRRLIEVTQRDWIEIVVSQVDEPETHTPESNDFVDNILHQPLTQYGLSYREKQISCKYVSTHNPDSY
jgi:hypothetical protein